MKRSRNVQGFSLKARWGKQINPMLSTREQGEAAKQAGEGILCLSYLSSHPRTRVMSFMEVDGRMNQLQSPGHHYSSVIDSLVNLVSCLYRSVCLISSFLSLRNQLIYHLLCEASLDSSTYGSFSVPKAFINTLQGFTVTMSSSNVSVSPRNWELPGVESLTLFIFSSPAPNTCSLREQIDGQTQRYQGHSKRLLL